MRIEQPQSAEVTGTAELLRCGGQQQQPPRLAGDEFDHPIRVTRLPGCPVQVMGLVDNHQVPLGDKRLFEPAGIPGEKIDRTQHQLLPEKWIERFALDV